MPHVCNNVESSTWEMLLQYVIFGYYPLTPLMAWYQSDECQDAVSTIQAINPRDASFGDEPSPLSFCHRWLIRVWEAGKSDKRLRDPRESIQNRSVSKVIVKLSGSYTWCFTSDWLEKNRVASGVLGMSTKLIPLYSPSYAPSNEPTFNNISLLLAGLCDLTMSFLFLLT